MTQSTVSIMPVIHTKPVMWAELLERVDVGMTTPEDKRALSALRWQLDCIAAAYPGHEYFAPLARLMGLHQQMSQAASPAAEVEVIELAEVAEEDEPQFPSQEEWELEKLYRGKVKPIILGGEK